MPNTLRGKFELRVDRITGSVIDSQDSATMQIEVYNRTGLIGTVEAGKPPKRNDFEFSFPVEDRFTGAEVVSEAVFLLARDNDGNTGRLALDGTAQLELARAHLGVPAVVVLDLDFTEGGNARPYLGAGWSGTEPEFTWTEDIDSFIHIDRPPEPGTYALRMTVGGLVRRPDVPGQDLSVFVNDNQISRIGHTEPFPQFYEFKFAYKEFGSLPRTTLRLHHPDAVRPSDLGIGADSRRLAFRFRRLTLARLVSA